MSRRVTRSKAWRLVSLYREFDRQNSRNFLFCFATMSHQEVWTERNTVYTARVDELYSTLPFCGSFVRRVRNTKFPIFPIVHFRKINIFSELLCMMSCDTPPLQWTHSNNLFTPFFSMVGWDDRRSTQKLKVRLDRGQRSGHPCLHSACPQL